MGDFLFDFYRPQYHICHHFGNMWWTVSGHPRSWCQSIAQVCFIGFHWPLTPSCYLSLFWRNEICYTNTSYLPPHLLLHYLRKFKSSNLLQIRKRCPGHEKTRSLERRRVSLFDLCAHGENTGSILGRLSVCWLSGGRWPECGFPPGLQRLHQRVIIIIIIIIIIIR